MTGMQLVDSSTNIVYNLRIIDKSKTTKPVWRGGQGWLEGERGGQLFEDRQVKEGEDGDSYKLD